MQCPKDTREGPNPLEAEDAFSLLRAEELPPPLGVEEAKGVVPIPDEIGAFLGALASTVGAEIARGEAQATEIAVVGAAMISTSSSLWVETLEGAKVTRGVDALIVATGPQWMASRPLVFW